MLAQPKSTRGTTEVNPHFASCKSSANLRGMNTLSVKTDLTAEVWRLEEIAEYLRLPSVKAAYPVVKRQGFPMSIVPGNRNRRWLGREVKEFLEQPQKLEEVSRILNSESSEPQIIHKRRKVYAA